MTFQPWAEGLQRGEESGALVTGREKKKEEDGSSTKKRGYREKKTTGRSGTQPTTTEMKISIPSGLSTLT